MPTEDLRITGAGPSEENMILVELSDGRTMTFSLEQILSLMPVAVVTEEEAARDDEG